MDSLLYVLCLLVGVALPLGFFGLVGRRAWRQLAVAEAYRIVARSLGLSVDTRGVSVHGHLDGSRLYVGQVLAGYGSDRRVEHRGTLSLSRPLGLGLLVRRRKSRGWLRRPRAGRVRTADAEFDRVFEVFGDDEERVQALLDGPTQAAIIAFAHRWPDVMLTDHHVRVLLERPEASPGDLGALVDGMRRLADRLVDMRRRVRPPDAVAGLVEPWTALGERLGLPIEPWLPALSGHVGGRDVIVMARRDDDGWGSEIVVRTRPHREIGLRLDAQTSPDGYWSVGQDIQVGDPEFDKAFVIKGWNPSAVRKLLAGDARGRILGLVTRGLVVELDDQRLRLRKGPLDAAAVDEVLREGIAIVDAIGW
jgi:hypothetical protein